jgi:hypothetical protein
MFARLEQFRTDLNSDQPRLLSNSSIDRGNVGKVDHATSNNAKSPHRARRYGLVIVLGPFD